MRQRAEASSRARTCLALALAGSCLAAAALPAKEVTVMAKYQDQSLQVTDGTALAVPRHHAGFYVAWVDERSFLDRRRWVEGASYRVRATLERVEVKQFPEGWGARTGQPYSIYHLHAASATRARDKQ